MRAFTSDTCWTDVTTVTVERVKKALTAVTVETPEVVETTITAVTVDRRLTFLASVTAANSCYS